jgi:hypothetical protein
MCSINIIEIGEMDKDYMKKPKYVLLLFIHDYYITLSGPD